MDYNQDPLPLDGHTVHELLKRCGRCREIKTLDNFQKSHGGGNRHGRIWVCNDCRNDLLREHYQSDLFEREYKARIHVYRTYQITPKQWDAMLARQGGVCAICKGAPSTRKGYHVDHDHTTGKLRGLLCSACNTGLGSFRDNPRFMRAAIDYLKQHN